MCNLLIRLSEDTLVFKFISYKFHRKIFIPIYTIFIINNKNVFDTIILNKNVQCTDTLDEFLLEISS